MKVGKIKYDDKHDSYFIESNGIAYSCFTVPLEVCEEYYLMDVCFEHSIMNEVTAIESFTLSGDVD